MPGPGMELISEDEKKELKETLMDDTVFIAACQENYGAMFQMLRRTLNLCPKVLWDDRTIGEPFWQRAYHALFFTDFYLSESPESFKPTFFVKGAENLEQYQGSVPTRKQLLEYLGSIGQNCEKALAGITSAALTGANTFPWTGATLAHRLVYNIRHTQHHIGDLNAILSRYNDKAAEWVIKPGRE